MLTQTFNKRRYIAKRTKDIPTGLGFSTHSSVSTPGLGFTTHSSVRTPRLGFGCSLGTLGTVRTPCVRGEVRWMTPRCRSCTLGSLGRIASQSHTASDHHALRTRVTLPPSMSPYRMADANAWTQYEKVSMVARLV